MRYVGTSDRNFYDRYYFNIHGNGDVHGTDQELFAVIGVGHYPNLSVADAFVSVLWGDDHRVIRSSRTLGADRMDASVGPIRVEVQEGLRRVRVVVEPNQHGIELDAVYDGFSEALLESRHFDRQFSRVTFDSTRFAQTGSWTGMLKVGDREIALTPDRWWGSRDRSWGVRPVGEAEHPGIRVTDTGSRVLLDLRPGPVRRPCAGHHHPGAAGRRADHERCPPRLPGGLRPGARMAGAARARPAVRPRHPPGGRRHPLLLRGPGEEDGRGRGGDVAGVPAAAGDRLRARVRLEARHVPGGPGGPGPADPAGRRVRTWTGGSPSTRPGSPTRGRSATGCSSAR